MHVASKLIVLSLAALALPSGTHAATLTAGDAVTLDRLRDGLNVQSVNGTIGAGTDVSLFGAINTDLNAGLAGDQFVISSNGNYCGFNCDGSAVSFIFSGLDFGTDFVIDNFVNNSGYSVTTTILSATSFSLSWIEPVIFSNTDLPLGTVFSGTFSSVVPAPVPLPAGAPLLLSALGVLAWRRKKALAAQ